jgi:hypothetical protein
MGSTSGAGTAYHPGATEFVKLTFLNVYLEEKIEDTNGQREPPVNQKDITIQWENAKGRTDKQ